MATDKLFSVAGVSTQAGKTKIRFANDVMRIKILAKNGHTNIDLAELPKPMTKAEIAQHLREINFAKGNKDVEAAVAYIAKKNPTTAVVGKAAVKSAAAVAA